MGNLMKRASMTAVSLLIAGGTLTSLAAPANAATVPNRYYCDPSDNWCYQVNGAYNPSVGRECHWKLSGMAGKPHQINILSCNTWGPIVA